MMKHETVHVEQGNNSIHISDLSGLVSGNYVLVMNIGNDRFS